MLAARVLVNGAVALWLALLGRSSPPESVPLRWCSAGTLSAHNPQHLMNFYALCTRSQGCALLRCAPAARRLAVYQRLVLAVACSGVREVVENTPFFIARFNDPSGMAVCRGDSIVNALIDTGFVLLGFLAAHCFSAGSWCPPACWSKSALRW